MSTEHNGPRRYAEDVDLDAQFPGEPPRAGAGDLRRSGADLQGGPAPSRASGTASGPPGSPSGGRGGTPHPGHG